MDSGHATSPFHNKFVPFFSPGSSTHTKKAVRSIVSKTANEQKISVFSTGLCGENISKKR